MSLRRSNGIHGLVLDRQTTFTMGEFCRATGTDRTFVRELVAEGIIQPLDEPDAWHFHGEALIRARRAYRLMQDLGINLPGAALALDLLDEIERLRQDVATESKRVQV